jgi:hypothetical protein
MEHFEADWGIIGPNAVLRYFAAQSDGEELTLPSSGNRAFVVLPNNERVTGIIRHVKGQRWEFETENGVIWSLEISPQPILSGGMCAHEFTVLNVGGAF